MYDFCNILLAGDLCVAEASEGRAMTAKVTIAFDRRQRKALIAALRAVREDVRAAGRSGVNLWGEPARTTRSELSEINDILVRVRRASQSGGGFQVSASRVLMLRVVMFAGRQAARRLGDAIGDVAAGTGSHVRLWRRNKQATLWAMTVAVLCPESQDFEPGDTYG